MLTTTHVGSLPKPKWLAETEKLWPQWRLTGQALTEAKERAAAEWIQHQQVHVCYGYGIDENLRWKDTLGTEWRQYEKIFPVLNNSRIDQISLECAESRVPQSLMGLLPDKDLMVGVVSVTPDRVASPEEVAAVIRTAMAFVEPDRLYPSSNCGMAPVPYDIAVGKLESIAAGAAMVRNSL